MSDQSLFEIMRLDQPSLSFRQCGSFTDQPHWQDNRQFERAFPRICALLRCTFLQPWLYQVEGCCCGRASCFAFLKVLW